MSWPDPSAFNRRFYTAKLLVSLFAVSVASSASAFTNIPWVINGNAAYSVPGRVVLTPNSPSQDGSMWNPCTISMNSSFDMTFAVNFGASACGADGMDFVLQNNGTNALGPASGEHGYTFMGNSIAVSMDTWSNTVSPYSDPPYDSMEIQVDGSRQDAGPAACGGSGQVSGTCGRPPVSSTLYDVKDGLDHSLEVQWNALTFTLTVLVDGVLRATWTFPSTFVSTMLGGNPNVYYGFTASTGGSFNYQQAAQTSANPGACVNTPTVVTTNTPVAVPTNACGTPTPFPTLTNTPVPPPPSNTFTRSPTYSLTRSPTPTPSITMTYSLTNTPVPGACAAPALVKSGWVFKDNYGASNTLAYVNPGGSNTLLLIRLETDSTVAPTGVSYAGSTLVKLSQNTDQDGGLMQTWYMVNPPSGSNTLLVTESDPFLGHSYNVAAEIYSGVNQASPIGATAFNKNAASTNPWSNNITTLAANSVLDEFLEINNAPGSFAPGPGQVNLNEAGGCCNATDGSYKATTAIGTYSMSNTLDSGKTETSEIVEIKAASCGSPTPTSTPTPSISQTAASTLTFSMTPTPTVSSTPSLTPQMKVTKTTNVATATLGDTLTFCLQWSNDATSAQAMLLWDTLSPALTFLGCDNACSVGGSYVQWNLGPQAPGASGSACVWVKVTGYP